MGLPKVDLMGAIFMCNRKTKKECLEKKLFGLPPSQGNFLKNVKAGMLLFLFEYEERKLYGVFEATSDGALNIMPDAYLSTGKTFPAQILFKRVWFCKPLSEDEFSGAIKENYYMPHKFKFGLSRHQVLKLVQLFFRKKIKIEQPSGHGIPNKLIMEFERSHPCTRLTGSLTDGTRRSDITSGGDSSLHRTKEISYTDTVPTRNRSIIDLEHGSTPIELTATKKPSVLPYPAPSNIANPQANFDNVPIVGARSRNGLYEYTNRSIHNFPQSPSSLVPQNRSTLPHSDSGATVNSNRQLLSLPSLGPQGSTYEQAYRNVSMHSCLNSSISTFSTESSGILDKLIIPLSYASNPDSVRIDDSIGRLEDDHLGQHFEPLVSANFIPQLENNPIHNSVYMHSSTTQSKNYMLEHDECYYESDGIDDSDPHPTVMRSRLYSNSEQSRPSAFLRLSRAPLTSQVNQTVLRYGKGKSAKHTPNCLSERPKQWTKKTKYTSNTIISHDDKSLGDIADKELCEASLDEIDSPGMYALLDRSPTPPPSFKRRSDVRKQFKRKSLVNFNDDGEQSSSTKRRRLIRPDFNQNKPQTDQSLAVEVIAGGIDIENSGARNALNMESSLKGPEGNENAGGGSPLKTLTSEASETIVNSSITNRNYDLSVYPTSTLQSTENEPESVGVIGSKFSEAKSFVDTVSSCLGRHEADRAAVSASYPELSVTKDDNGQASIISTLLKSEVEPGFSKECIGREYCATKSDMDLEFSPQSHGDDKINVAPSLTSDSKAPDTMDNQIVRGVDSVSTRPISEVELESAEKCVDTEICGAKRTRTMESTLNNGNIEKVDTTTLISTFCSNPSINSLVNQNINIQGISKESSIKTWEDSQCKDGFVPVSHSICVTVDSSSEKNDPGVTEGVSILPTFTNSEADQPNKSVLIMRTVYGSTAAACQVDGTNCSDSLDCDGSVDKRPDDVENSSPPLVAGSFETEDFIPL